MSAQSLRLPIHSGRSIGAQFRACLAAIALAASAGCATMTVSSHVQEGLDLRRYHTYDWGPADALPTGDPRLDQNPFFQDHVQGAVERQMASKGFARAPQGGPADLLLHYHAVIQPRFDIDRLDRQYGYCANGDCRGQFIEYEQGTLVLDVVDVRANRVIWRGWAQDTISSGLLNDQDRLGRQIERAVKGIFSRFPRPL